MRFHRFRVVKRCPNVAERGVDGVRQRMNFRRLLFASDYPHWDFDDPFLSLPPSLSDARRRAIYADNARALYRLA